MFLTGAIFATSDLAVVNTAAQNGYKLLYIGDSMEMPRQFKFVDAVAFTPDYQCMCAIIGNNTQKFEELYYTNLSAGPAQELFAVIIAALRQGNNIMMYFPSDSLQLKYPVFLMQFMEQALGIQTGTDKVPPMYNEQFNLRNMRLMYLFKLIPWKEFLLVCEDVDPIILARFKEDICPALNISPAISDLDMMNKIEEIKKQLQSELKRSNRLFTRVEESK